MSKQVLVVGSINVDYVIHTARLPRLGETITGRDFAMNFGGKGANQAVALAKVGCDVRMLGAVGRDRSGELALANLTDCGVDASAVARVNAPTGAAVITVCGGDNHIILDDGANAFVTPDMIEANAPLFDWADTVVLQYEIPIESVLAAARQAKQHGCRVMVNPAPAKEVPSALYPLVDLIVPNEFEAQLLTDITPTDRASAEEAIRALLTKGCGDVVLTLGENGSAYSEDGSVRFAGIYPVTRADTTAAGDSFIGGLCAKLCEGRTLSDAVAYAAAVAAITVSRNGASVSIPTSDEVDAFLACHRLSGGL